MLILRPIGQNWLVKKCAYFCRFEKLLDLKWLLGWGSTPLGDERCHEGNLLCINRWSHFILWELPQRNIDLANYAWVLWILSFLDLQFFMLLLNGEGRKCMSCFFFKTKFGRVFKSDFFGGQVCVWDLFLF